VGLYFALGPTDFYPSHYTSFIGEESTTEYAAMDTNLHGTAETAATSIAADETIRADFALHGYYTVHNPITEVQTDSDGNAATPITDANLRITFLNTEVCDNKNYGLMKHLGDPGNQLFYLETELY
jgi:hypothetical protein